MTIDFVYNLLTTIFFDTNMQDKGYDLWTWSRYIRITGLSNVSYAIIGFVAYKLYTKRNRKAN